jgi:PHD/YefM family antitoxin component YafN of YafNO toxin-antitoxin module
MTAIPRKYITDARNQKQAVIVDLETFKRMESIIEDHGLKKIHGRGKRMMRSSQSMKSGRSDSTISKDPAKRFYA